MLLWPYLSAVLELPSSLCCLSVICNGLQQRKRGCYTSVTSSSILDTWSQRSCATHSPWLLWHQCFLASPSFLPSLFVRCFVWLILFVSVCVHRLEEGQIMVLLPLLSRLLKVTLGMDYLRKHRTRMALSHVGQQSVRCSVYSASVPCRKAVKLGFGELHPTVFSCWVDCCWVPCHTWPTGWKS